MFAAESSPEIRSDYAIESRAEAAARVITSVWENNRFDSLDWAQQVLSRIFSGNFFALVYDSKSLKFRSFSYRPLIAAAKNKCMRHQLLEVFERT